MARFVDISKLMFADPPDPAAERIAARVKLIRDHLSADTAEWRKAHEDTVTSYLRDLAEMFGRKSLADLVRWADTTFSLMGRVRPEQSAQVAS